MTPQQTAPERITPFRTYLVVYIGLLFLTLATTLIAFLDLGPWSMVIALIIAAMKALLVILFFMDALHNHRLNPALLFVGFVWLCILIVITLSDYVTRGWIPFPGK
ncbi:MAG: cytochrome C oxidase subunit IV family protein [Acidobacteriota bacterium]|nr:cytochrome C oxidase subunit IV family protein [Acidobacteriota bacterium]